MTNSNDFALFIGVRDYRIYDPSGRSDVAGALNDARAWVRQCLQMGFSPERIRVLTSPVLPAAELGPHGESIGRGEATHEGISNGLTWLMKELGAEGLSSGLMTFSGHGAQDGARVLLCPSDMSPSGENVIDMLELRQRLGNEKAAKNLTLLLDGCHTQVGLDRKESIQAKLHAKLAGLGIPEGLGVAERVIASCQKNQQSVASRFDGEWMGAFTWSAISTLSQWRIVREKGVLRSTLAYGELVSRSRALLSALSFEQEPVLSGPQGVAALPFLHPGDEAHAGETSAQPDGRRPFRQLDAGSKSYRVYEARWDNRTLATILVPNESYGEWLATYEYWFFDPDVSNAMYSAWDAMALSGTTFEISLTQDNEWSTPFSAPIGTYEKRTVEAASFVSVDGDYRAFANDGLGIEISGWAGSKTNAYPNTIQWFNTTAENFYFTSASEVGSSISMVYGSPLTFNYRYNAQLSS